MSKQLPAVCYTCGADVPETPRFGNEATCDKCQREGRDTREKGDDDWRDHLRFDFYAEHEP